jgi:phosphatidylinositol 4-kinase
VTLCKCLVPILFGIVKSTGRIANEDPSLLCRIFPRPKSIFNYKRDHSISDKQEHNFYNFRSIISSSLCNNLNPWLSIGSSCNSFSSSNKNIFLKHPLFKFQPSILYDPLHNIFNWYGSNFNQISQMYYNENLQDKSDLQFNVIHLQSVLALAKKLLTKEMLSFLDKEAQQVFFFKYLNLYFFNFITLHIFIYCRYIYQGKFKFFHIVLLVKQ